LGRGNRISEKCPFDWDSCSLPLFLQFRALDETVGGVLDLGLFFSVSPTNLLVLQNPDFTASVTKDWLETTGKNILWLPGEYHATSVATYYEVVVLGIRRGAFILFIFDHDMNGLRFKFFRKGRTWKEALLVSKLI
jgi:hypothetical protein